MLVLLLPEPGLLSSLHRVMLEALREPKLNFCAPAVSHKYTDFKNTQIKKVKAPTFPR